MRCPAAPANSLRTSPSSPHPLSKSNYSTGRFALRSLFVRPSFARPEVMLVYEMNGEPLKPAHGFPLRLIVPGWYGMASAPWPDREVRPDSKRRMHGLPVGIPSGAVQQQCCSSASAFWAMKCGPLSVFSGLQSPAPTHSRDRRSTCHFR